MDSKMFILKVNYKTHEECTSGTTNESYGVSQKEIRKVVEDMKHSANKNISFDEFLIDQLDKSSISGGMVLYLTAMGLKSLLDDAQKIEVSNLLRGLTKGVSPSGGEGEVLKELLMGLLEDEGNPDKCAECDSKDECPGYVDPNGDRPNKKDEG